MKGMNNMEHIVITKLKYDPTLERLKRYNARMAKVNNIMDVAIHMLLIFTILHTWIKVLRYFIG